MSGSLAPHPPGFQRDVSSCRVVAAAVALGARADPSYVCVATGPCLRASACHVAPPPFLPSWTLPPHALISS
jgi:hypothetical protein